MSNEKLKNNKHSVFLLFLLIAHSSLLIAACGYSLVGKGSSLPPHIKNISIPVFSNKTGEPNIEFEITNRIREGFIEDGRLKMVNDMSYDLILHGEIIKYSLKPVVFDSKDNVTEYWVEITVLMRLEERVSGDILLQKELYTKWDYLVSQSVTEADIHRLEAIRQAGRKLAQEIVSTVIEGF
jgi:hypothetical protein